MKSAKALIYIYLQGYTHQDNYNLSRVILSWDHQ